MSSSSGPGAEESHTEPPLSGRQASRIGGRTGVPRIGVVLIGTAIALAGCSPGGTAARDPSGEPPLEIEEVGAAPDAAHDPSTDPQGKQPAANHLGVLPGDYPPDLPIPPETSLVDYGDRDDGGRFIELHTPSREEAVRRALEAAWSAAGWERRGPSYTKGGYAASLTVEAVSPTLTRVEITWRRLP